MLNQRNQEYDFDVVSDLRVQGLTTEAITLYLNRLKSTTASTEDRDPGEQRQHSYLLSGKRNSLFGTLDASVISNSQKLQGTSIFNWDVRNGIVDLDKTIYCDMTTYTISRAKNFNNTNLVGGVSSIKEYISTGDYQISITGTFYNDAPDIVPVRSVQRLIEMTKYNGRIEITNTFLNEQCGIFSMIMDNFSISQSTIGNLQSFNLSGRSDLPEPPQN